MLSQTEADNLISMQKKRITEELYCFPSAGDYLTIPIKSLDDREEFLVDINRKGIIRISRCTYQERFQKTSILIRLDLGGRPHTNPDAVTAPLPYLAQYINQTIQCPHLHLYVENYGDKWAIPADTNLFPNTTELLSTVFDFFTYCNIIEAPNIQGNIF